MMRPAELDPPEVETWLDAQTGDIAFDVGANTGRVAARLSERFGQVFSFEPAVESFERLKDVVATHPGVVALPWAVSDVHGEVTLYEQATHMESGQLSTPGGGGEGWEDSLEEGGGGWGEIVGHRNVLSVTLDQFCSTSQFAPDFVKIDIEGHELRAVRGAMDLFTRVRPRFYIEVHNVALGKSIVELLSPLYPSMDEIRHPYYKPTDFGAENHFWLVSG